MKKKVLFLCTGNSCRSQMAEGILIHYFGSDYDVYSAGTKPSIVNTYAVKVMQEIDIDISGHVSKHIKELRNIAFDIVITVCDTARDSCPISLTKSIKLSWSFEDPAYVTGTEDEIMDSFRNIRNLINQSIKNYFSNQVELPHYYFK